MSTKRKILFSALLITAIVASMVISLGLLVRPTYEYRIDGETGEYTFSSYNGNENITELTVDRPMVKIRTGEGSVWQPDEEHYVSHVKQFTVQNDEYLRRITIGPNVKSIDECAFVYCRNLREFVVDKDNENYVAVDGVLFTKDMKTLIGFPVAHETGGKPTKEYVVPEGVERLARNSFYKCEHLEKVVLPSSLKEIGKMSFFKCWGLKLVDLPEGVETLGSDAFSYCTNMRYAFFIPAGVKTIEHHCFYKCDNLEKFFVASQEDGIELGGKWMPKSENAFEADAAVFGADKEDWRVFNDERVAQEEPAEPETEPEEEEEPEENAEEEEKQTGYDMLGMNKTAVLVMIFAIFIPGVLFVGREVVRNLFKEDFLMTKRGKERLRKTKEEKEAIHRAYVNGEYAENEEEGKEEENDG